MLVTRGSAGSRVSGPGVFSEASWCGRGLSSSGGRRKDTETEGEGKVRERKREERRERERREGGEGEGREGTPGQNWNVLRVF